MSLILDALKKLDREKQAPDRGLVVVGPSSWPSVRDGRPALGAGIVALAVLALAGIGATLFMLRSGTGPEPPTRPAAVAGAAAGPASRATDAALPPAVPAAPRAATGSAMRTATAATPAATTATPAATTAPPAVTAARPSGSAAEPAPPRATSFQLQAISAQDGKPIAILNGRLVREGDSFDGVRVLRIGAEEVEIEVAGHRRVVKF